MLVEHPDFALFLCGLGFFAVAALSAGFSCVRKGEAQSEEGWRLFRFFAVLAGIWKWLEAASGAIPALEKLSFAPEIVALAFLGLFAARFWNESFATRLGFLAPAFGVALSALLFWFRFDFDFSARCGFLLLCGLSPALSLLTRRPSSEAASSERVLRFSCVSLFGLWVLLDIAASARPGRWEGMEAISISAFALTLWLLKLKADSSGKLPWRSIGATQGLLVVLLAVLAALGWKLLDFAEKELDSRLRSRLESDAVICAKSVDPARVKALSGSKGDVSKPDFKRLNSQFKAMALANPQWRWIYLIGARDGQIYSLVDSLNPSDPDASPLAYPEAPPKLRELLRLGAKGCFGPYSDRWGEWISASVPVFENGIDGRVAALLSVDVDASVWRAALAKERALHLSGIALLCVLLLACAAMAGSRIGRDSPDSLLGRYAETWSIVLLGLAATSLASVAVWRHSESRLQDEFAYFAAQRMERVLEAFSELRASCDSMESFAGSLAPGDFRRFAYFAASFKRVDMEQAFGVLSFRGVPQPLWRLEGLVPAGAAKDLPSMEPLLDANCLERLARSRESGLRETAGPFLKNGEPRSARYLTFRVFDDEARRPFALLVSWNPQRLLAKAANADSLLARENESVELCLQEASSMGSGLLVARFPEGARPSSSKWRNGGFKCSSSVSFFGRVFLLRCEPGPEFRRDSFALSGWIVLATGSFLTLSLAVLAYIMQGGRRRAEALVRSRTAALKRSEERFAQVSEQSREMIWEVDSSGVFVYVSKGAQAILGAGAEELVGKRRLLDFSTGPSSLFAESSFSSRKPMKGQICELLRVDGQRIWTSRNAIPQKAADGSFSGYLGSDYDISSSKRSEDGFAQHAKFLQDLIDAIPNPVYYKNELAEYLGCNKAFESYLGLRREQIIGRTTFDVSPREFAEKYDKMDRALLKSGGVQTFETVVKLSNGCLREALFNKAAFKNPDGSVGGFIGVIVDISDRKKIEGERLRNEAHLDSLMRLSQFHSKSVEDLFDFALEQALRLSESSLGFIFAKDDESGALALSSLLSFDGSAIAVPPEGAASSAVIRQALLKASSMTRPLILNNDTERGGSSVSVLAVPVSKGAGHADAVLIAVGKKGGYENSDAIQLSLLMESIWKIYERNLAEENVRQDLKSLGIILNILHTAMEEIPLKSVLSQALRGLSSVSWFNFTDNCAIQLVDESTGKMRLAASVGDLFKSCERCEETPKAACRLCGQVFARGATVIVKSDEPAHSSSCCHLEAPHSHCSVLIRYGQQTLGVLNLVLDYKHKTTRNEENFLQALSGVLAVVIQRRKAEDELRRAHLANETLINSMPIALISLDKAARILEFNPAAERLFQRQAKDVLRRTLAECQFPWDYDAISSKIESFKKSSSMAAPPEELSFERLPDKQEGCLRVTLSKMDDAGTGSGAELLLIASDITERRDLEAQLLQAQKLEAIGQLAAGIAHEINTPTQYIGDNLAFLQDSFKSLLDYIAQIPVSEKDGLPQHLADSLRRSAEAFDMDFVKEEAPKALQQSIEGVSRISEIVQAMKAFSHPGLKGKSMADLNKALSNTLTVARNEWKYVADVKTDFASGLPPVPCVPGEINQVFLNIIVNAAHSISDVVGSSGKKGLISISTKLDGDMVEVRIKDSGGGIPDSIKNRIFEPFFTTKGVGKGTGQGLSIARSIIVKRHGGQLYFESEKGEGATFVIRLPSTEKPLSEDSQLQEARQA